MTGPAPVPAMAPLPRATLAHRGAALMALAGPSRRDRRAIPAAIPLASVAAAPEWLCLPAPSRQRLARLMALLCWAATLADSIDGRLLATFAAAAGADADWALDTSAAATAAIPPLDQDWPAADLTAIGHGLMAALLRASFGTAPLADLLGPVPLLPAAPARATLAPALERLRTSP